MILTTGTITLAIDGMQHYLVLSSNWEMFAAPFIIFAITYFYILMGLKFGILKRKLEFTASEQILVIYAAKSSSRLEHNSQELHGT